MNNLSWRDIAGFPYKLTKTEHRFNCIFCPDPDNGYHLYVNRSKKVYHCFRCGAKGVLIDKTGYGSLLSKYATAVKRYGSKEKEEKIVKSLPLTEGFSSEGKIHRSPEESEALKYLLSRGINHKKIYENDIRYSKDKHGIYTKTIVFPVGDIDNPDYFVCRRYDGTEPKYINAPWPKGDILFMPFKDGPIYYWVVCEGIFDAMNLACCPHSQPVALLGKEATDEQIDRLCDSIYPLLICLDPDAESYAMKLTLELKSRGKKAIMVQLEGKDPGDTPRTTLRRIISDAYLSVCPGSRERSRKGHLGDGYKGSDKNISRQGYNWRR